MKSKRLPIYLSLSLTLGGAVHAQEHRQEGVHEHGVAHLDLAQEGKQIDLHLESPAMNLVGYEHMPSSEADRQALEKTLARLRAADQVFHFDEQAQCRLISAQVDTPLTGEPRAGDADHDEGHDADHDEGHEHGHHHHADIDADYRFECASPGNLSRMSVALFRLFPATHRLLVQFVTDRRQGGAELTPANAELAL